MAKKRLVEAIRILEKRQDDSGREFFPVVIIQEGLGNLRDRNFYTEDAIKSAPDVYEGKPAYGNHPNAMEEQLEPNRRYQDMLGHYEDVEAKQDPKTKLFEAHAKLYVIQGDSRKIASETLEHAVNYKKKYPTKNFVGISINGDGEGETVPFEEGIKKFNPKPVSLAKLAEIEGQDINWITKFTEAFSADLVTLAGAGGKLTENAKGKEMKEKLKAIQKKILSALENKKYEDAEKIAKELETLKTKEDEATEAKQAKAETDAKAMMQAIKAAKKEVGEKKESETDEEYEGRMEAAVAKGMMSAEAEDDGDGDDGDGKSGKDKKPKPGEEGGDGEGEAEEGEDDGDGDDDDAPDVKKLHKAIKQMQSEIAEMKDGLKTAKKAAAEAQTKLTVKARQELIATKLAECGQPRRITKLWRPLLETCKDEADMDTQIKALVESVREANKDEFFRESAHGNPERTSEGGAKNDDLFS